jgi:uncharacterized membrane protein
MHARLLSIWRSLIASFWFVPGLMSAGAAVLSFLMIAADEAWQVTKADAVWFLWTGGAEGARKVLSTIAASMIGIAGVTFSILVVALAQASSQFGPRVLRSFMRDTGNQIALGTFIATFLYCVLVLRTVRGANGGEFVPDLSVSLGIVLGVCSVAVLIYFLHHAAMSIQAPHIVTAIADELDGIIEGQRVHESNAPEHTGWSAPVPELDGPSRSVPSPASGYLEAIDFSALVDCARKNDLVLRLRHRAGEFVYGGTELLRACPAQRVDDGLARVLTEGFTFKPQKLPAEAIDVGMLQLVEVAVRSLSPSLNDPFTALACIERLADALLRVQCCPRAGSCRYDEDGRAPRDRVHTHGRRVDRRRVRSDPPLRRRQRAHRARPARGHRHPGAGRRRRLARGTGSPGSDDPRCQLQDVRRAVGPGAHCQEDPGCRGGA